ncbi:MAG: hypothetical protein AB2556_25485, partial [Candidatus Thiodiazotropha sp.]
FTQGSKADGKRLTRRLVTDQGELDYLVRDTYLSGTFYTRLSGTLVGAPMKCELGHILTYYYGSQPQFTHLQASMLAYAHINLLSMLSRFEPDDAVRMATDSLYIWKTALHRLDGVESYIAPRIWVCGATLDPFLLLVAPAQWRDKGEKICMPQKHADYRAQPASMATKMDLPPSTALPHALSYLNGGGGSGKTTQAIELFRQKKNPCLHPNSLPSQRNAGQRGQGPNLLPLEWPD